ncbi:hypothetical protein, partial [Streptomyces sp. NPDC001999]
GTYAIDLAAMFFAFPNTIFPFLADELDAGPLGVGAGLDDRAVEGEPVDDHAGLPRTARPWTPAA